MPSRRFVLRPRPPVRAIAIIAVAVLVAAVLVVVGAELTNTVIMVVAIVLAVVAVALALVTLIGRRRLTTTVDLDDDGLAIASAGRRARVRWSEINHVRAAEHHIYVSTDRDADATLQIVCPQGAADPQVEELSAALARRLDADRGYRSL